MKNTAPVAAPTATPAATGGGDIWGTLLSAGASLAGGYLSGQGASAAGKAEASAANAATALNKDIYYDQRGLAMPGYLTGGAATNKLAAMYGIAPQNYTTAFNSGGGGGGGGSSGGLSANLGAGQPVQGHTGGGGPNALAQTIGGIAGSFLPIPIPGVGTAIGTAIGGLIRNGGDNWTTVATQAPPGFDYATYLQQPDLAAEWSKPDIKALFGGNQDAYANWHYNQFGKNEGRTLNASTGGQDKSTMPVGGAEQMSGGTQAAYDPMADFMGSMENRLATQMSDVGFGKIKGALGAAGKSISGAGEKRYANEFIKNRYGAFGDYKNGLQSLAGQTQTSANAIGNAGANYGSNAGQSIMAAGKANGNALAGAYKGYGDGIAGAAGEVNDFGKKNWGWG